MQTKIKVSVQYGKKPSKSAKAKNGWNYFMHVIVNEKTDSKKSYEFYHCMRNAKRGAMRAAKKYGCKVKQV